MRDHFETNLKLRDGWLHSGLSPFPLAVVWAQYGPYHFARIEALRRLASCDQVVAIELSNKTSQYEWTRSRSGRNLVSLFAGTETEKLTFRQVFLAMRKTLAELNIRVCLLPSYSPEQSMAAFLAAKSLRLKTVMMNDSHAGTARASGFAGAVKRRLVRSFDAALVAGRPHKRYFESLGLPSQRIFTGYDVVDNDHFASEAEKVRGRSEQVRKEYGLPERYFLSLGRLVPKKNVAMLIRAYAGFLNAAWRSQRFAIPHLVVVGSGAEEHNIRELCSQHHLTIADHAPDNSRTPHQSPDRPAVHFYGFRQIEESPAFYALADAFFLPSLHEEWGLVVNEAMACGLPVVVSKAAGCAEDLLEAGPVEFTASEPEGSLDGQARLIGRIRRNGFAVNPESAEELAQAMAVLAKFPKLRRDMGQASRRIISKFSCECFAENAIRAAWAAIGAGPGASVNMAGEEHLPAVARFQV